MRTGTRGQAGYTFPELVIVVGIMGVVTSMAVFQIGAARPGMKGDGAMRVVTGQLNAARELSITQRRNIAINFLVETNEVQHVRQEVPLGQTVLSTTPIEGSVRFLLFDALPDTPEAFGKDEAVDFGEAGTVLFTTDGTLIDQTGTPVNGTVFLGIPGQSLSARAVTVLGATGRVRAYKWNGARWVRA
jgi:prepilin-type N-terminal cleavage/methylation domain-containing protein